MLDLIKLTFILSTPLIFGAMGGFTSERAGVTNIGLEGLMLTAACITALFSVAFGAAGGLVCGVLAATMLSLLHWLVTQHYRIDHVISGMAINAIAAGGTNFLYGKLNDPNRVGQAPSLPVSWYTVLAFVLPLAIFWFIRKTRGGLRLLAVGSDPDKARLMGVQPISVRLYGLIATGVFCGLGGSMLVSYTGVFTDNMTAGRGFIALAALVLSGWRPVQAFLACIAFGFFSALQIHLQGTPLFGMHVPTEAWASLPYLVTIVALAGFLGKNRSPAGIGKP